MQRILLILLLGLSLSSKASILLDPYFGYAFNGSGDFILSNQTRSIKGSGVSYGGRAGLTKLGLMVGIDYAKDNHSLDITTSGVTRTDKINATHIGTFLGYTFPFLLRIWGTYYFNTTLKGTDPTGQHYIDSSDTFKNGSGYALGLGLTPLPLISLNVEYRAFEYGTYENSGYDYAAFVGKDFNYSYILFSVSVPLELF